LRSPKRRQSLRNRRWNDPPRLRNSRLPRRRQLKRPQPCPWPPHRRPHRRRQRRSRQFLGASCRQRCAFASKKTVRPRQLRRCRHRRRRGPFNGRSPRRSRPRQWRPGPPVRSLRAHPARVRPCRALRVPAVHRVSDRHFRDRGRKGRLVDRVRCPRSPYGPSSQACRRVQDSSTRSVPGCRRGRRISSVPAARAGRLPHSVGNRRVRRRHPCLRRRHPSPAASRSPKA